MQPNTTLLQVASYLDASRSPSSAPHDIKSHITLISSDATIVSIISKTTAAPALEIGQVITLLSPETLHLSTNHNFNTMAR